MEDIDLVLNKELRDVDQAVKDRVREKVHSQLSGFFRAIQVHPPLSVSPDSGSAKEDPVADRPGAIIAPAVPRLVKWLVENEKKFSFFSVKFLRERVFDSDPAAQEALQFAIDQGILETYKMDNPINPSWPVTACRLNRDHPTMRHILGDALNKKSA